MGYTQAGLDFFPPTRSLFGFLRKSSFETWTDSLAFPTVEKIDGADEHMREIAMVL